MTLFFSPFLANATNYYVNDANPAGDVYCTAVGNAANNGTSPATPKLSVQAIVSTYVLAGGDIVYIDAGIYTEEISLSGLTGSGVSIRFQGAGAALTTIQGIAGGANPYTLQLVNCSYLNWTGLRIVGASGEWSTRICDNSDYNEFADCAMSGLYGMDFINMYGGGTPDYNQVHDCIITSPYVGVRYKWGASYNVFYDNRVLVVSTGSPVFGALEYQSASNNRAYRNVLSCTGRCDEGTVYSGQGAAGNVLTNNYILNLTAPTGGFQNPAVEVDDNAGLALIHNSIYAAGPCFRMDPLTGVMTATNMVMRNNIFYSSASDCLSFTQNTAKLGECDNNLYYAPAGYVARTGGVSRDLASWKSYDPDVAALNELNGTYGDPLYNNPAADDLDIASSASPAVDAVVNVIPSVTVDIYKISRPQGSAPEIGAFELLLLPVRFLNFSVDCIENGVQLEWITLEEKNNHYFTLESSREGIHFSSIAQIKGAGNSLVATAYQYLDTEGTGNYYRLKQTDYNGTSTYSEIIRRNCTPENSDRIRLWYNGQALMIGLQGSGAGDCMVSLYTVTGQLLYHERHRIPEGIQPLAVVLPDGAAGLYIVQVEKDGQVFTSKIIY